MINYPPSVTSPVPFGKTISVANEDFSAAGTKDYHFVSEAEAILVSVFVPSTASTLDVAIWTLDGAGGEFLLANLPQVQAPSAQMQLVKGAQHMGRLSIRATFAGACSYRIYARGVSSAEASVTISGATTARASQTDISVGAPQILIPAALSSRQGLIIMNNNSLTGGDSLYIGFSPVEASIGFPVTPQGNIAMDVGPGVVVWARSSSTTTDVRILEGGS